MRFSMAPWVALFILFSQAGGHATPTSHSCTDGNPEFVSHPSPQRFWQDPQRLRQRWEYAAVAIQDEDLRRRLMMAFEGLVCTRDLDLLTTLLAIFREAEDSIVRAESLYLMRYLHFDSVLETSRTSLRDASTDIRLAALTVIASWRDRDSITTVRELAETDPDEDVRKYAKKVLRSFEESSPADADVQPTSTSRSCMDGKPEFISYPSRQRLWRDPASLRERWEREAVAIQDEDLRRRVMWAFQGMICTRDSDLLTALLEIFRRAEDSVVQAESLYLMSSLRFDSVLETSRTSLHHPLKDIRLAALSVTSWRHDRDSIATVRELAAKDPDGDVREYAEKVLKNLEEPFPAPP